MKFGNIGLALGILALSACTSQDKAYRDVSEILQPFASKGESCDDPVLLADGEYATAVRSVGTSKRTLCYLSSYIVPGAQAWRAHPNGHRIKEPDQYRLSFVELPENKRVLPEPMQLDALAAKLNSDKQDIVVVFVHGWRHDAVPGNGNVRNFRTMLGYTRSALNARCVETGLYCKARLTGVYLGWRGRSFREPTRANAKGLGVVGAFPTVWGRKKQSEKLAVRSDGVSIAGSVLRKIERQLIRKHGNPHFDKMLVMGHSFGGNMLAEYLRPTAEYAVENHRPGDQMEPILGDLVVLLNPAGEAKKFTDIQLKMRQRAGIADHVYAVRQSTSLTTEQNSAINIWRGMFDARQRPFYVSLTAAQKWGKVEPRSNKDSYDKATALLFPVSRAVALQFGRNRMRTIGHQNPKYDAANNKVPRLIGPPLGTTHEFVTNSGNKHKTSYENAGSPTTAWCGSHQGWLAKAQKRKGGNRYLEMWDTGHTGSKPILNNMGGAEFQIRHGINPEGAWIHQSVAQGTSPFWNGRAYGTAVYGHSGFTNFPTLCAINLMLLDDATAQ